MDNDPANSTEPEWLSETQAAERIGVSQPTLARLRRDGEGPAYYAISASFRYRSADVDAWLEKRRRNAGGSAA